MQRSSLAIGALSLLCIAGAAAGGAGRDDGNDSDLGVRGFKYYVRDPGSSESVQRGDMWVVTAPGAEGATNIKYDLKCGAGEIPDKNKNLKPKPSSIPAGGAVRIFTPKDCKPVNIKKDPNKPEPGVRRNFAPGGGGMIHWYNETETFEVDPIPIDSFFFDDGPSGMSDPLMGATIEMDSFMKWTFNDLEGIPGSGARFEQSTHDYSTLRIMSDGREVLNATFAGIVGTAGSPDYSARLVNVGIINSIGSPMLDQLAAALAAGEYLQLDLHATENLSMLTAAMAEDENGNPLGLVSYATDGWANFRGGLSTYIPAPGAASVLVLSLAALARRRR